MDLLGKANGTLYYSKRSATRDNAKKYYYKRYYRKKKIIQIYLEA